MRILYWNELYAPWIGGTEIFTSRLATRLVARGHQVLVVAARHPASLPASDRIDGIEICRLPFYDALERHSASLADRQAIARAVGQILSRAAELKRKFRPDVVHVNFSGASSHFHLTTAKAHPSSTVVTFQTALTAEAAGHALVKATIATATHLVALGPSAAANVAETTGVPLERIATIPPGVPPEEFTPRAGAHDAKVPVFTFLGRLVHDKGADLAIEAAARARTQCEFKLRLIGDGPEHDALARQVSAHDMADIVEIVGFVDDARRRALLSESFALVVPSRHLELFGMVAVEGALSALPVIVANRGGLTEIVKDHETGLVVPPNDADALATAMLSLVRDRHWAMQLGQAGRQRAVDKFGIDAAVDRYEELYAASARSLI
jgi:glycosyltransferase involved in cell wall biosynthesis